MPQLLVVRGVERHVRLRFLRRYRTGCLICVWICVGFKLAPCDCERDLGRRTNISNIRSEYFFPRRLSLWGCVQFEVSSL